MTSTVSYGEHADQVLDLLVPTGPLRGVALLVHGGYWRLRHTRSLMVPLAQDLAGRGWVVANVEYRRLGGGGRWPSFLEDVTAACRLLARRVREEGWPGPVVAVGHSVGGQLALLASGEGLDAVVALAPVTDLARTRSEGLGEDAVRELLPEGPEESPQAYAEGSPVRQLPRGLPLLVVHAEEDPRVPLDHSRVFVERARAAGDRVELIVVPGADHLSVIDPQRPWWDAVTAWMASGGRTGS